ncbi:MAG: hypothetical protein M3Q55_09265 [Acidobacteriota bacterium]|nr:hypothetical protein [Acidobacteriota bacterium]
MDSAVITACYVAYIVDARVGTAYVGGYQVHVERLDVSSTTEVSLSRERLPRHRRGTAVGISADEAEALLASTIALLKAEGRVVLGSCPASGRWPS